MMTFALLAALSLAADDPVKEAETALKKVREAQVRADKAELKRVKELQDAVTDARKEKSRSDRTSAERVRDASKRRAKAKSTKNDEAIAKAERAYREAREEQDRARREQQDRIRRANDVLLAARRNQSRVRIEGQKRLRDALRAVQAARVTRKPVPSKAAPPEPAPPRTPRDPDGPHVVGTLVNAFVDPPLTLLAVKVAGRSDEALIYLFEGTPVTWPEVARNERALKPGLQVMIWLRQDSEDRAGKVAFSLPGAKKK